MDWAVDTTGLAITSVTCCGQGAQSVSDTSGGRSGTRNCWWMVYQICADPVWPPTPECVVLRTLLHTHLQWLQLSQNKMIWLGRYWSGNWKPILPLWCVVFWCGFRSQFRQLIRVQRQCLLFLPRDGRREHQLWQGWQCLQIFSRKQKFSVVIAIDSTVFILLICQPFTQLSCCCAAA